MPTKRIVPLTRRAHGSDKRHDPVKVFLPYRVLEVVTLDPLTQEISPAARETGSEGPSARN